MRQSLGLVLKVKGKSISHGTAALEYDLAKEINGEEMCIRDRA